MMAMMPMVPIECMRWWWRMMIMFGIPKSIIIVSIVRILHVFWITLIFLPMLRILHRLMIPTISNNWFFCYHLLKLCVTVLISYVMISLLWGLFCIFLVVICIWGCLLRCIFRFILHF